jgi:hypothetical protein
MEVFLPDGSLTYTVANIGIDGSYSLSKFKNQMNVSTNYSYDVNITYFNVWKKKLTSDSGYATNYYALLSIITHPTGYQSFYNYDFQHINLGSRGLQEDMRVYKRYDKITSENATYNEKSYYYINTSSGWPDYHDPDNLGSSYFYYTKV